MNFNSDEFNVHGAGGPLLQFAATILLAMGLVFQVPVAILGATRAGLVTPQPAAQGPPLRDRGVCRGRCFPAGRRDHAGSRARTLCTSIRGEYPDGTPVARRDATRSGAQAAAGNPRVDRPSSSGPPPEGGRSVWALEGGGSPNYRPTGVERATEDNDTDPGVNAIIDHMDRKLTDLDAVRPASPRPAQNRADRLSGRPGPALPAGICGLRRRRRRWGRRQLHMLSPNGGGSTVPAASPPRSPPRRSAPEMVEAAAWKVLVEAQFHQASEPGNIATVGKPRSTPRRARRCSPSWLGHGAPTFSSKPVILTRNWRRGSPASSANRASTSRHPKCRRWRWRSKATPACASTRRWRCPRTKPATSRCRRQDAQDRQPAGARCRTRESKEVPGRTQEKPLRYDVFHDHQRRERQSGRDAGRQNLYRQGPTNGKGGYEGVARRAPAPLLPGPAAAPPPRPVRRRRRDTGHRAHLDHPWTDLEHREEGGTAREPVAGPTEP